MRKEYIVYVERYDFFDSFCDHLYHESCYETLGSNPIEALKAYRKLKSNDYDYGDSYQRTRKIQVIWVADKPTNNHNFFTKEVDRLKKFPVIGWDGEVIDYVVTSFSEVTNDKQKLNDMGYYYNPIDNTIRSLELTIEIKDGALPYISDEFDGFDIDSVFPF